MTYGVTENTRQVRGSRTCSLIRPRVTKGEEVEWGVGECRVNEKRDRRSLRWRCWRTGLQRV